MRERDGIRPQRRVGRCKGAVADGTEVHRFGQARAEILGMLDARREEVVIQDGLDGGKSLQSHEFFPIEIAVRFSKLCVSLMGDLSKLVIKGHVTSLRGYGNRLD